MEYTSGGSSWGQALRRLGRVLPPGHRWPRQPGWGWGVPLIVAAAGLLFTTSATTAQGTDLREDRRPQFVELIGEQQKRVDEANRRVSRLRDEVEAQTNAMAGSDAPVAELQRRARAERPGAGLVALKGQGLTVRLDDAPRAADGTRPNGASVEELVVHQQDVQAVVNALWAGGAEAMSIAGVRVVSTSAVRCVGNTLLLHGRVYSPPFVIVAIGDPVQMRRALDDSEGVRLFAQAAKDYGLGYQIDVERDVTVPAYDGSTSLRYARAAE